MFTCKYKQRPAQVGVHKYADNDCVDSQQGWEDKGKDERRIGWVGGWKEGKSKDGGMDTLRSESGRKGRK